MKINLLCAIGALSFCTLTFGQNPIPNASFENWTDDQPDEWVTSNVPDGDIINVTATSPGHSGDFALRGEVIELPGFPGFPFLPLVESNTADFGFPISENFPYFSMYYQFHQVGPEDMLSVFVGVMDDQGTVFGGGFADITSPSDTFTLLNVPMTYTAGQPYRAFVTIGMNSSSQNGFPEIGSYFIIDDLWLGGFISAIGEVGHPLADELTIFPNPVADKLTVAFSLLENSPVSVQIIDLMGQRVANVFQGDMHDGNYTLSANVEDLPTGLYFVQIATQGGTLTQKVLVSRS